ncbi:MAG: ATP-binding protein [Candidatus Pacebacteria bacterium]|nr:ATP-binding protein [Candidatus Paceibacterota bacterium]MDD5753013.1 ATP-binding protein [Candidatus Paceibacterota bacterium]
MFNILKLEEIVNDQLKNLMSKDSGMERLIDFDKYINSKQIVILSGIRRSGKSTLLKQFSEKLSNDFYYVNFDDERLMGFKVGDFDNLLTIWKKNKQSKNIFIDEIQNIESWERFVRRVYEEGYKVFITGSNAKLLSSELSTHLTGRYFKIELYPFSFKEVLLFNKIDFLTLSSSNRIEIIKKFDEYLITGGFPEFIRYNNKEFLKRTYEDIVYKDIITRFGIREITAFRELSNFLFNNFTKKIGYQPIAKTLGIKSSISVRDYIGFLQESYLVFELFKYDYSLKKQYISDKKIYIIDNGMRNTVAFSFSEDKGRLLENLVFIELKRRGEEVYFSKGKKECDFLIKDRTRITNAIQICYSLDKENEKREVEGLIEAINQNNLKSGLILTYGEEKEITFDNINIKIMPVWKWLLERN